MVCRTRGGPSPHLHPPPPGRGCYWGGVRQSQELDTNTYQQVPLVTTPNYLFDQTFGLLAGGTGGCGARQLPCCPARHRSPPGPATPGVPWRARTQRPHGGRLHPHPPLRGFMFLCPLSRALTRANQGPYTPFIHPRPTLTQVCQLRCGQPPHQSGCAVRLLQCCGTGFNYSPPRSRNLGGREHAWA